MSKWFVPKTILAGVLVLGYAAAQRILYPTLTSPSAVQQVEDTAASYTGIATVESLWRWGWLIVLLIIVALFIPDVVRWARARKDREDSQRILGA